MRVVITGGTGLIGRALTTELAGHGFEVAVVSRHGTSVAGATTSRSWDGKSADGWGDLVDGAVAIGNLAGEPIAGRWTPGKKDMIRSSRTDAGHAIILAIAKAKSKPKMLVQSSAVGFYGPRADEPLTEQAEAGDDFLSEVCVAWEASTEGAAELGVRRCVMRTGIVLSLDGGAFPRMLLPFRLFAGGPVGSGHQYLPWIHLDDVVAAYRFVIENDQCDGVFNLTAPNPLSNREASREIGRRLKRPAFIPAPGFALRMVLGEMSTLVLDGQRAIPARLEETGYQFQYQTLDAALVSLFG